MTRAEEIKALILASVGPALRAQGLAPDAVPDDFDLRASGLVDSLGFMRLMTLLEQRLTVAIDLSALDPAQLTCIGTLSRHIAGHVAS